MTPAIRVFNYEDGKYYWLSPPQIQALHTAKYAGWDDGDNEWFVAMPASRLYELSHIPQFVA